MKNFILETEKDGVWNPIEISNHHVIVKSCLYAASKFNITQAVIFYFFIKVFIPYIKKLRITNIRKSDYNYYKLKKT